MYFVADACVKQQSSEHRFLTNQCRSQGPQHNKETRVRLFPRRAYVVRTAVVSHIKTIDHMGP